MTNEERKRVFEKVEHLVRTKYFDPHFNGRNWPDLVLRHRPNILAVTDDQAFEVGVNALLGELGTSHTRFFSPQTKVPSRSSVNATFRFGCDGIRATMGIPRRPTGGPFGSRRNQARRSANRRGQRRNPPSN